MLNYYVVLLIAFTTQKASTESTCRKFGAIQLLSGRKPSEGRVEFCNGSHWGRVCRGGWDDNDAAVVCRELGYTADGAHALYYWYGHRDDSPGNIIHINCHSREPRLRNCIYSNYSAYCPSGEYVGVRCRAFKTINVTIPYNTMPSVVVTWEYHQHNRSTHQLTSFHVECSSEQHYTWFSVNKGTFKITVDGLLPFMSYNCCVSAILYYYRRYTDRDEKQCSSTLIETMNFTSAATAGMQLINNDSSMRANIIGGVLGFIIVILVLLLVICAGVLLYLLRSRTSGIIPKRSPQPQGANTTGMCVDRNISYVAAPSHSTTSGSQAAQATRAAGDQSGSGAAAEYSRIGPSYAATGNSRRQPMAGRNRVSARLSERYEFSETHLASAGGSGGQGEATMDYEVPLQSGEHEDYSRLQH